MTALERVARAAYEANITRDEKIRGWSKTDWSLIHPDNRENWRLVARAVLMAVLSDMQRYEPDGDGYGWFGMSKDDSGDYIDISGLLEELKDTTND